MLLPILSMIMNFVPHTEEERGFLTTQRQDEYLDLTWGKVYLAWRK